MQVMPFADYIKAVEDGANESDANKRASMGPYRLLYPAAYHTVTGSAAIPGPTALPSWQKAMGKEGTTLKSVGGAAKPNADAKPAAPDCIMKSGKVTKDDPEAKSTKSTTKQDAPAPVALTTGDPKNQGSLAPVSKKAL